MVGTWVLKSHAAAAIGIEPWALDLPRRGYGISADALWVDPRFIEARRSRDAIARQMAERRYEINLHQPEAVKVITRSVRKKVRAKKRKQGSRV
jgi:hypothetical protein